MFARAVMPIRAFLDRSRRQLAEIPLDSAYQFSIKSRPLLWIAYWFTANVTASTVATKINAYPTKTSSFLDVENDENVVLIVDVKLFSVLSISACIFD